MRAEPADHGFRDDLRVEIEPIGSEPAPPRERPRRRVLVALAICGVAALVGWAALGPHGAGGPSTSPTIAGPTSDSTDIDRSIGDALRALNVEPEWAAALPGVWWGPVLAEPVGHTFGNAAAPLPAGEYDIRVACVGDGLVTFGWSTIEAGGYLPVPCDPDGRSAAGVITLPDAGDIRLMVADLDGAAAGRAGFAVTITDPRMITAQAALGPGGDVMAGAGTTAAPLGTAAVPGMKPGTYRLTLVCVGAGSLMVTLRLEYATREVVGCDDDGARLDLELASTALADLTVTLSNLGGRPGAAAFAYRVDRDA